MVKDEGYTQEDTQLLREIGEEPRQRHKDGRGRKKEEREKSSS